ncbi:MAG TPA: hypothetical protein VEK08_18595 [Planctomycetota bacterium]|nr:hypothetical protein [Planctomycetota bacterium]
MTATLDALKDREAELLAEIEGRKRKPEDELKQVRAEAARLEAEAVARQKRLAELDLEIEAAKEQRRLQLVQAGKYLLQAIQAYGEYRGGAIFSIGTPVSDVLRIARVIDAGDLAKQPEIQEAAAKIPMTYSGELKQKIGALEKQRAEAVRN